GSANGAESGADLVLVVRRSAVTAATTSATSSKTCSSSASSESSITNRPSEPSTCALATPGIRRTGSSTTAEYSCQLGNGSNGSRSRCTRRPLCQRTGGGTPSGEPLDEPFMPRTRPVECAIDGTRGPSISSTGLANRPTVPAAPVAVDTPARTTWPAPPVRPATTPATPGMLIRAPSCRYHCPYRA